MTENEEFTYTGSDWRAEGGDSGGDGYSYEFKITAPTPNKLISPREPVKGFWSNWNLWNSKGVELSYSCDQGTTWTACRPYADIDNQGYWTYTPTTERPWPAGTTHIKALAWVNQGVFLTERTVAVTVVPPLITHPPKDGKIGARAVFIGTGLSSKEVALYVGTGSDPSKMKPAETTGGNVDGFGVWDLIPHEDLGGITAETKLYFQARYADNTGTSEVVPCTAVPLQITSPTKPQIGPFETVKGTWGKGFETVKLAYRANGSASWTDAGTAPVKSTTGEWAYTPAHDKPWPAGTTTQIKASSNNTAFADERIITVTVAPLVVTQPGKDGKIGARGVFKGTGAKDKTVQLYAGIDESSLTPAKTTGGRVGSDGKWTLKPTENLCGITDTKVLHFQVRYDDDTGSSAIIQRTAVPLKITDPTPNKPIAPREHVTGTWHNYNNEHINIHYSHDNGQSWSAVDERRRAQVDDQGDWTYRPTAEESWPDGTNLIRAAATNGEHNVDHYDVAVTVAPLTIGDSTSGGVCGALHVFAGKGVPDKKVVLLVSDTENGTYAKVATNPAEPAVGKDGTWSFTPKEPLSTTRKDLYFKVGYADSSDQSPAFKRTISPLKITSPGNDAKIADREPLTGTWLDRWHASVFYSADAGATWVSATPAKTSASATGTGKWTYTPASNFSWPANTNRIKVTADNSYDEDEQIITVTVAPLVVTQPGEDWKIGARGVFKGTGVEGKIVALYVGTGSDPSEMTLVEPTVTVDDKGAWTLAPTTDLGGITAETKLYFQARYADNTGTSEVFWRTAVPLKITSLIDQDQIGPHERVTGTWHNWDGKWVDLYYSSGQDTNWVKNDGHAVVDSLGNWTYTPPNNKPWPADTTRLKATPDNFKQNVDEYIVAVTVAPLVVTQPKEGWRIGARGVFTGTGAKDKEVALYVGTGSDPSKMTLVEPTVTVDDKGGWTFTPHEDLGGITAETELYFQARYTNDAGTSDVVSCTAVPLTITSPTKPQVGPFETVKGTWGKGFETVKLAYRANSSASWTDAGTAPVSSSTGEWAYTPAHDKPWPAGTTTQIKASSNNTAFADERIITVTVAPLVVTQPGEDWKIGARGVFKGTGAEGKIVALYVGTGSDPSEMTLVEPTVTVDDKGAWTLEPTTDLGGITAETKLYFQARYADNTGTSDVFWRTAVPLKITSLFDKQKISPRERVTGTWHNWDRKSVSVYYSSDQAETWTQNGSSTLVNEQGDWTFTPDKPWPDDTTHIKAYAWNRNQNLDECIVAVTVVPLVVTHKGTGADEVCGGRPVVPGTGAPRKEVTLWSSTTEGGSYRQVATTEPVARVDEDGNWSLVPTLPLASARTPLYLKACYTDGTDQSRPLRRTIAPLTLRTADPEKALSDREGFKGSWVDGRVARVCVSREDTGRAPHWLKARPEATPKAGDGTGAWAYTPSADFSWLTEGKDDQEIRLRVSTDNEATDRDAVEIAVRVWRLAIRNPVEGATIPQRHIFKGVGPPHRTVEVKRFDDGTIVGQAEVGENGRWAVLPSKPLEPTTESVPFVVGSDELGWSFVPVAAKVSRLAISQPQKEAQACPWEVFNGMGRPGSTVKLSLFNDKIDEKYAVVDDNYGEAKVADDGRWSIQPSAALPAGRHKFIVQESGGGEEDVADVVCTVVPLQVEYPAQYAVASPWQVFTGSGPAGHEVKLYIGSDAKSRRGYGRAVVNDKGRWRLEADPNLPVGRVTVSLVPTLDEEEHLDREKRGQERQCRVRFVGSYSDGAPGQVVPLGGGRPGPGQTLLAVTGSTQNERGYWAPVDSFAQAGEGDQVFRVDPAADLMMFGPKLPGPEGPRQHGAVPPREVPFTTVAAATAGAAGNLQAGSLTRVKGQLGATVRVHQGQAAVGGQDGETPAQALARFAGGFALGRAVTAADYRRLLGRAGIGVGRVVCAEPTDEGRSGRDLRITLIPLCGEKTTKDNVTPASSMLRAAWAWLEAIRPLGTVLTVGGPAVREVGVTAEVELWSRREEEAVRETVCLKLAAYLHPLTGGPQGDGWPLGVLPQPGELYPLLEAVPAIRTVHRLEVVDLAGDSGAGGGDVLPLLSDRDVTLLFSDDSFYRFGES
ncbi:baseplate J/gp47 family protein [Streptomyces netropsis]